jgi:hypothetical protein
MRKLEDEERPLVTVDPAWALHVIGRPARIEQAG